MKTCPLCKIAKPVDDFPKQTKSKDGRYPYCRVCTSARHRLMYAARGRKSWLEEKTCSWCKKQLPRADFRKFDDGKLHSQCTTCEAEVQAEEARGHRFCNICRRWMEPTEFHPSKLRYKHIACKVCVRAQTNSYGVRRRNYQLQKDFGITLDQYKQLLAHQDFHCPICRKAFETDNFSYPVDHAHAGPFKGRIRAIVHEECNRYVLWLHDDAAQLRNAADLIEHPLTEWMVPEHKINPRRRKHDD